MLDVDVDSSESEEVVGLVGGGAGPEQGKRDFHAQRPTSPFDAKPGHGIRLTWENLDVHTAQQRQLLFNLTGSVKCRLMAIMGPTGAGKTTLMNTLARRANGVIVTNGGMEIDGYRYSAHNVKGVAGYVMQDDLVFENLTVYETLQYAADLRLPRHMSKDEKRQRVEETLTLMQLNDCRDLKVGNPRLKGISGSERKRLCVSIELLMRPRLLFLDEPTTGLDSSAAYSLMSILRDLAHSGACTIVATIHQPQAKIVYLLDDLVVLCEGKLVYSGPAGEVTDHYARAGFPCPLGVNPADHLMEVITPMTAEELPTVRENAVRLVEAQRVLSDASLRLLAQSNALALSSNASLAPLSSSSNASAGPISSPSSAPLLPGTAAAGPLGADSSIPSSDSSTSTPRGSAVDALSSSSTSTSSVSALMKLPGSVQKGYRRINWFLQLWILFCRALLLQLRAYRTLLVQLFQVVVCGILVGTIFLDIGVTQSSYNKRLASLFFIVVNQGSITSMVAVNAFPAERAVVLRERAAGTYRVSAYFMGKVLSDLLVQIAYPVLFSCIVYWLIGYQADAGKFFIFVVIVSQLQICGFAMANFVASLGRTTALSLVILPLMLEIWRLFGGFFLPPSQLPGYFVWLDAIDFLKYGFVGLALNELEGLNFVCDPALSAPCLYTSGEDIIIEKGYDQLTIGGCIGILFGFIVGYRVMNYLFIRFFK